MTDAEIVRQLQKLAELWLEKTGKRAHHGPSLVVSGRDNKAFEVYWYNNERMTKRHANLGDTSAEAFRAAFDYIANLPTPEQLALQEYNGKLADLLDHAHSHNIADKYVAPVREVRSAVSENLLEAPV